MKKEPCLNHKLALPNDEMSEAKNIAVTMCKKCKWFIKLKRSHKRGSFKVIG